MSVSDLADPRAWPAAHAGPHHLYADAEAAIGAATGREADVPNARIRCSLAAALAPHGGNVLAEVFANPPSPSVARHLHRLLADVERGEPEKGGALRTTLFALPVILVAALDAGASPVTLDGVVPDTPALAEILRDARAFSGCETFALSASLVALPALDLLALPALLARVQSADVAGTAVSGALDLPPTPIEVAGSVERVYLRFIPGAVLTPARVDPFASSTIARWGMAFASAITRLLAASGVSLLALPRPPQHLVLAVQAGSAAQREVSAQLFASNAIRKFRASYGEPTAIISAHRAAAAPGGGELRLSLSSPFAPESAEGFRCPIYLYETVQDVGSMLGALLRDCRVSDVRFMPGIHADIDPVTHAPLFFNDK
jgi:hypothetical protein